MINLFHTSKKHKKVRRGFGRIDFIYIIIFYLIVFGVGIEITHHPVRSLVFPVQTHASYISPLPTNNFRITFLIPSPTATPIVFQSDIINKEIDSVFGKYSGVARQLLTCENSTHNPEAINTVGNYPEGSQDIGLFQINNYWNDIGNVELLKDPQVNIAVAYHKFVSSGYNFNQWTCGRKLGI